jgi:hypothetical protein
LKGNDCQVNHNQSDLFRFKRDSIYFVSLDSFDTSESCFFSWSIFGKKNTLFFLYFEIQSYSVLFYTQFSFFFKPFFYHDMHISKSGLAVVNIVYFIILQGKNCNTKLYSCLNNLLYFTHVHKIAYFIIRKWLFLLNTKTKINFFLHE